MKLGKEGDKVVIGNSKQWFVVGLTVILWMIGCSGGIYEDQVREEFLKLYVAYKAETNFVDVIPQAKKLRLSLNMKFHEIEDPKGLCRDVTGLGRWGNGDVEVSLSNIDELPYVIGLIRQSLEKQMGNGENPV